MSCCGCAEDWHGPTGCWNCACTKPVLREPDTELELAERCMHKAEADVEQLERQRRADRVAESAPIAATRTHARPSFESAEIGYRPRTPEEVAAFAEFEHSRKVLGMRRPAHVPHEDLPTK